MFYPGSLHFFKIEHIILRVTVLEHCPYKMTHLNLQTGLSGLPVVVNGRRSQSPGMLLLAHQKEDSVHQFES